MKKLIVYGIWFMVSLMFTVSFLPLTTYAAGATLSVSPASGTIKKGCKISIDVKLDTGGSNTDGTDAILFYDPTKMIATSIRSGTIYPDYPGNNIDAQNGKITVSGVSSAASTYSGSGTLATIDFTVPLEASSGAALVKFDFDPNDKAKTSDSNVAVFEGGDVTDVLNQVTDGNFVVSSSGGCSIGGSGGSGTVVLPTKTPVGGPEEFLPTKTPVLPQGADFQTTWAVAAAGIALTVLGAIGLALL